MSTFRYSFLTTATSSSSSSSSSSAATSSTAAAGGGSRYRGASPGASLIPSVERNAGAEQIPPVDSTLHPSPEPPPKLSPFPDVQSGIWYEESLVPLIARGVIDANPKGFRPADSATRAELAKMLVKIQGIKPAPVAVPSFRDALPGTWYAPFLEVAAQMGWIRGDNNCAGSATCTSRPGQNVSRAEAALMIARAFALTPLNLAPGFPDVTGASWYETGLQAAADRCVLRGDDGTGKVRPNDRVTRAEIVVMLARVEKQLQYGKDCSR